MDKLHTQINNLKAAKPDSKSVTHFPTTMARYVSDMKDNTRCPVLEWVDQSDNSDFGREIKREGKEETASNLITRLHRGASIRSREKANTNAVERNEIGRNKGSKKTENNATNSEDSDEETCPLGFTTKYCLAACTKLQILTVNQCGSVWECITQTKRNQTAQPATNAKKKKNTTGTYIMRRLETLTQVWIPRHHRFQVSSKIPHVHRTVTSKEMLCKKKANWNLLLVSCTKS